MINVKKHRIFVESSCVSAVSQAAAEAGMQTAIESYDLNRADWVTQLVAFSNSSEHVPVIIPNSWLEDEFDPEKAKRFLETLRSGILRIGIWGYTPVFPLPFPAMGIMLDRGKEIRSALLLHLSAASFPGVHNTLVPGSFICAERLGTDLEIGRCIDRLVNNISQRGVVFKKKAMKLRVAITAALSVAMEELGAATKLNPPTIQIGSSQNRTAVSIKWKSKNKAFENWISVNPPIDLCLKAADAFLVHLLPESENIELLMVFSDQSPDYEPSPFCAGYDYFTTNRRQALKDRSGIIQKEEYQYGTFRNLSEPIEQKEEIISSFNALIEADFGPKPLQLNDSQLELQNKSLRSENQLLNNRVRELSKALNRAVDTIRIMKDRKAG